eukprot:14357904-Ditylum_brightwellii.AAC.1
MIAQIVAAATHKLTHTFAAKVTRIKAEAEAAAFFANIEIKAATVNTVLNLSKKQPAGMEVLQDAVNCVLDKTKGKDELTNKWKGKPK